MELRTFFNRVGRNWFLKDEMSRDRSIKTLRVMRRECEKTQRSTLCLIWVMNRSGFRKYPLSEGGDARLIAYRKIVS